MRMKKTVCSLELTEQEIRDLEQDFFTVMTNFKGKIGSEAINQFKEEHPLLYKMYRKIAEHRESED